MIDIITNFIREWLKEIVVLFIIISLVDLIMPKGKMKRYVDFIIGILIIFTVISPFTRLNDISLDIDREVSNFTNKEISDETLSNIQEKQIKEMYTSNLKNELLKVIEEQSEYILKDIQISTIPDKTNIFNIDNINIRLNSKINGDSTSIKVNKVEIGDTSTPVFNAETYTDLIDLVTKYIEIDRERIVISIDE